MILDDPLPEKHGGEPVEHVPVGVRAPQVGKAPQRVELVLEHPHLLWDLEIFECLDRIFERAEGVVLSGHEEGRAFYLFQIAPDRHVAGHLLIELLLVVHPGHVHEHLLEARRGLREDGIIRVKAGDRAHHGRGPVVIAREA